MEPAGAAQGDDRRALAAVALQFFVNGALFASFLPRLPEIRDDVGIDVARVGLLLSIAGVCGLAGSLAAGPAVGRFGSRTVMVGAGAVVSGSLAVVGFAGSQVVLVVGLAGMVSADVLVDVSMNLQGSRLSERRRVPVMNRLHGLWSLGAAAGGLSSSRLAASGVPLSVHLAVAGAVLFVAVVAVSPLLLTSDAHPGPPDPQPSPGGAAAGATRHRWSASPTIVLLFFAGAVAVAVESASIEWAAFRFTDDLGTGAGFAALGYVAVTAGMTVGRFGGDWIAVRWGSTRLLRAAVVFVVVGLTMATFVAQRHLSLVGYLVAGIGIATLLPTVYDRAARHRGRAGAGLGALTAGTRLSTLVVPGVVGALAGAGLQTGAAVAVVALPAVATFAVLVTRLPDPQPAAAVTAASAPSLE